MVIIAHSHGAIIAENALMHSTCEKIRNKIEVFTFDPARLLLIVLASRVSNYINEDDLIPELAATSLGNFEIAETSTIGKSIQKILIGFFGGGQEILTDIIGVTTHTKPHFKELIESAKQAHTNIQGLVQMVPLQKTIFDQIGFALLPAA